MNQINAPYNFVPLSDTVVIPEWGDKVSHDLPFRDGVSGELELTITALAPIMVGGEQKQGTERESGQVRFFQTPDKRYAIPGSSLRGVIRSVTEIATFSRMNCIDDKRFGLRDISGTYVSASYTERVRNNVSYGFLSVDAQGKPSITPCSMVRLSHRDLEKWWNIHAPVFAARTSVKQKYELWQTLCRNKGISDPYDFKFSHDESEVTSINEGQQTGFPVFTGQINAEDPSNPKFGTKYKGRPKNKDFMFHSPREQDTFVLDNQAWRDFLFIHGDEDGKPEMSWPGFWKKRFWSKQKIPVFYIQNDGRVQVGLAYMPKLAGDFSTHDMLQHTHKDHVDNVKPDFTELLFGRVGDKPEDALKGRVYFEPAFLQGQARVDNNPRETILNGAKPSYFPNYVYQQVDKSGEKLSQGQYATYVYSIGNPAPELRGWKRYPVRPRDEVRPQSLGDKQTTKVQTRLHTLAEGSTFTSRLVFHNLKPQELGALLWVIQFENKRHNLGMAKSFGYGQIHIKLDWKSGGLVCNDSTQTPYAEPDRYIAAFQQYMTEKLGKDWRTSTSIEALVTMADPACRDKFTGDLKHMVMGMGGNNEFVKAKQNALVLPSYVQDLRTLKRSSHVVVSMPKTSTDTKYDDIVIEEKAEVWENAKIQYDPSKATLTATTAQGKAVLTGTDAKSLINTLPSGEQGKAKKNQLLKSILVEGKGNAIRIKAFI